MRIFKKSLALLLALTMVLSVVGVSVFAADDTVTLTIKFFKDEARTTELTSGSGIKQGADIFADMYLTATAKTKLTAGTIIFNYNKDVLTATDIFDEDNELWLDDEPVYKNAGVIGLGTLNGTTLQVGENKVKSFKLSVKSDASGKIEFTYDTAQTMIKGSDKNTYPGFQISDISSFTISESDKITGVETAIVADKVIGTAVKDILPATVKVTSSEKSKLVGTNVKVAWDTANLKNNTLDKQTINGTINVEDPITVGDGVVATAEVTLQPITDGTVAEAKGTVMVDAENGITEDTIKKALPATLDVSKGDFKDTFAVEWKTVEGYAGKNSGKDYVADEVITVKGTLTSPSAKGLFTTTTTDVEGKVTVVPAEVKGGSISINNPIDNGYVTANITVPADVVAKMPQIDEDKDDEAAKKAKKAKRTVLVTVESKKTDVEDAKGEYEFTNDDIDKAKAAVAAATAEKPADPITVPTIKVDKKMKDLGYSSSGTKKFTVNVTVGGTTLLNGDSKDAVSGEVKKATSGNAGGIHKGGSTTTTYAVTVVETKNGTATVSPEKAASGATVTVKPEPAEGYKVKSVTAVKADGTNVPVDEKAYTFTMPASAVKVTVEFEEGKDEPSVDPTPAEDKFADVADDFWAAKDIYTLKDAGIIGGKSATEFDPEGDVTRAEFAKMVVGLFGYKATSDAVNFEDCKAEDWFTPYVAAGVEAGVIKGVSDTEFAPNATITREDACTILGRALNKVAQSNELKFTDADKVAEYAAPYVALLSELGYVNGYEDGSFAPANNITRAEAAKIIAGIYNAKDTTVTEDNTDATDTTDANVEGENTTAPVEENAEDKADTTDTIDVAPEK